jgi:RND family efflux transporter MFP subunit
MLARLISSLVLGLVVSAAASAQTLTIQESIITDFRPVVGRIEASDTAMARSRLQGVITQLSIDEGQTVKAGEVLAFVADDTIAPQINALQSRVDALSAQMTQQEEDLARASKLLADGFYPKARFDQEQASLNVVKANRASAEEERRSLIARRAEGYVRAPVDSRVTDVLVVDGSVVSPGQVVASLATLDGLVRLSLPERHLGFLAEGGEISLRLPARENDVRTARIEKIYPALRDGAVIADAVVEGGLNALVGERADVLAPVGDRRAIILPQEYVTTRYGVDFVRVKVGERFVEAPVVLAEPLVSNGVFEVLSGLRPGDVVTLPGAENS